MRTNVQQRQLCLVSALFCRIPSFLMNPSRKIYFCLPTWRVCIFVSDNGRVCNVFARSTSCRAPCSKDLHLSSFPAYPHPFNFALLFAIAIDLHLRLRFVPKIHVNKTHLTLAILCHTSVFHSQSHEQLLCTIARKAKQKNTKN